jgi:hypothetical protein
MTTTYAGTADQYLDSRDLIEYAADETNREEDPDTCAAIDALADKGIEDWEYGAHFIREDCFTEYAQEFAEDIGAISRDGQWPTYCIDWEWAARELQQDYTTVEYLGHTYYVR